VLELSASPILDEDQAVAAGLTPPATASSKREVPPLWWPTKEEKRVIPPRVMSPTVWEISSESEEEETTPAPAAPKRARVVREPFCPPEQPICPPGPSAYVPRTPGWSLGLELAFPWAAQKEQFEETPRPPTRYEELVGVPWPRDVVQASKELNPGKRRVYLVWDEGRRYKIKAGQGRIRVYRERIK